MYLVDTSVWIDLFRQKGSLAATRLKFLLSNDIPLYITGVIYQEILQGARDEKDFTLLKEYLGSQVFRHPQHPAESYARAGRIYYDCRRKGITIRSTVDCLIAQIAIEQDLILLHNDRDFERIVEISPELKLEV